jgi:predicted 3-demethylubiquinone-9 3-methyltransferase (glyoxalase superfamily)
MLRQKITTFLWFNDQAEEAARFYASIFPNSSIDRVAPGPGGKPFTVEFRLAGVPFIALNGGPHFTFNEAISLMVDCADQAEVDELWEKLCEGGTPGRCGWLKDKYGLSWQIVPSALSKLLSDPSRSQAVMQALLQMNKLDIQKLQEAYDSR